MHQNAMIISSSAKQHPAAAGTPQSSHPTERRACAETCHTNSKLVHILLAGLCSYLDASTILMSEFEKYPNEYHQLTANQTLVGWGHLLHGRLVSQCTDLQQDYMFSAYPTIKYGSDAWHQKILYPFLVECHTLWTLRNGRRHGISNSLNVT
jgi:hypothetical protein